MLVLYERLSEGLLAGEWRWLQPGKPEDDPAMNMAIDSVVLQAHVAGTQPPTIRLYQWMGPAVTIGRLQSLEAAKTAFPGLPIVRRPTGGKAVVHGEDLTITVAASDPFLRPALVQRGVLASYFLLLEAVSRTLQEYGIIVLRRSGPRSRRQSEDCFATAAACDLVEASTGDKVLGSAQLRVKGSVLQQMSLRPWGEVDIHSASFKERLKENFASALNIASWRNDARITPGEEAMARQILISAQGEDR